MTKEINAWAILEGNGKMGWYNIIYCFREDLYCPGIFKTKKEAIKLCDKYNGKVVKKVKITIYE